MANPPIINPPTPIAIGSPVQGGTSGLYLAIDGSGNLTQMAVSAVPPAGSVVPSAISQTATNDFVFPRDVTVGRNLLGATQPMQFLPSVDSTTAFELCTAGGVVIFKFDSVDGYIGINTGGASPNRNLHVFGNAAVTTDLVCGTIHINDGFFVLEGVIDYAAIKATSPVLGTMAVSSDTQQFMFADGTRWNVVTVTPAS